MDSSINRSEINFCMLSPAKDDELNRLSPKSPSTNSSACFKPSNTPNASFVKKSPLKQPEITQLTLPFYQQDAGIFSERLLLEPISIADEKFYMAIFTDKDITRFTGGTMTNKEANQAFKRALNANKSLPVKYITWIVKALNTKKRIGVATLTMVDSLQKCGEIGLMYQSKFQQKGFGCEVLNTLIHTGFNLFKLTSLISFTEDKNTRAQHVLKKYHFKPFESDKLIKHTDSGMYWQLIKHEVNSSLLDK